jgi:hypothetical protein
VWRLRLKARRILGLLLFLSLFLSVTKALAQPRVESRPKTTPSAVETAGYDLWIVDGVFSWEGKQIEPTLGHVVDALRAKYSDANFVLAPGLMNLKIADLKLRGGRIQEELEAIRVASGSKFDWTGPGAPGVGNPVDPSTGLPLSMPPNGGLFILREAAPTEANERLVEAFNLSSYLERLSANQDKASATKEAKDKTISASLDEIERIILETIATLKEGRSSTMDQPSFQFHRGANLLIVIGSREAVDVARKVILALPGQARFSDSGGGGVGGVQPVRPEDEAFRRRYGLWPTTGQTSPEQPPVSTPRR